MVDSINDFMTLSTYSVSSLLEKKGNPCSGVFIADGNRRMVMCKTGLKPNSEEFYFAYARYFVESLKKSLQLFFSHGLKYLFFPLFGPSLLVRRNNFQSITIPIVYNELFVGKKWLRFYNDNGIRLKVYGDLDRLSEIDVNNLNKKQGILEAVKRTASNAKHTLLFGFMADNTQGMEIPNQIVQFYLSYKRVPTQKEMIELYYGEDIPMVDFIILSNKLSGQGAFPPLVSTQKAKMYFLPVPGFEALDEKMFRRILFDLIYVQNINRLPEYEEDAVECVDELNELFSNCKQEVIGISKKMVF